MHDRELWASLMAWVLVALGAADVVAFFFEWREHRKWTRAAIAEAIGLGLLVALGLGDWHLHRLDQRHEEQVAADTKAENESLHNELDSARSETRTAEEVSRAAVKESKAAREEADQLRKDVEPILHVAQSRYPGTTPHEALNKLSTDLEGLKKTVQVEHDARVEIEHKLAPRHVDAAQHDAIVKLLKPFSVSTVVVTRLGDKEANDYATEIINTLVDGGWHVEINNIGQSSIVGAAGPSSTYGVEYKAVPTASGKAAGSAMALLGGKPNAQLKDEPRVPDAVAIIYVGLKPQRD